ncbi:MAG: hypothetical protein JKX97_00640 [Candidatus Lindowbacteria bacterium]|nr:hypothetical protein [Candidatus Lindowbacteria bacterium]
MNSRYKDAGVDDDAAHDMLSSLGLSSHHFGSGFATPSGDSACVSVESAGTKAILLTERNRFEDLGWDAAAMAINDIVVRGAQCSLLLDHLMMEKISHAAREIILGVDSAAVFCGAALIGGETAQLPGLMKQGAHYVSVTAIGFAEQLLNHNSAMPGDLLVGIESSGLHSNGFSLIRQMKKIPDSFLERTRIYRPEEIEDARCAAHITGGGLPTKVATLVPEGACAVIEKGSWTVPGVFDEVRQGLDLDEEEMWSVFNMGIGLVYAINPEDLKTDAMVIGRIEESEASANFRFI